MRRDEVETTRIRTDATPFCFGFGLVHQLEDMIKERINPELADQISFETEKDLFVS